MASIAKAFAVPKHDIGNGRTEEIRYNETGWPLTRVVEWPSSVPGHTDSFGQLYVPETDSGYKAERLNPREKAIDRNKMEEMQQLEKEKRVTNNLKSLQKRQSKGYDVGDQLEKAQSKYDNVFGLIKE